jgi:glyoxylase-like metal-dependent hydrolase (beta-lactamase superfamily II)
MAKPDIVTIDLNFQNKTQAIASYLIRHGDGAVLIESGPGSTISALEAGLAKEGLSPRDITHVLLTHIHLDHAGAAGWLHTLWGEFLPVVENQLTVPKDAEEIVIGNLRFLPINTPGHAEHHYCYLFEDVCFSGDVGGVRIPGFQYLRAPMPPPELHFGRWRESITRLRSLKFSRIAPTHFGIFDDPDWQLNELQKTLDETEKWLEEVMPGDPTADELRAKFEAWMGEQSRAQNLSSDVVRAYDLANPLGMGADGMLRYWKKVRQPS